MVPDACQFASSVGKSSSDFETTSVAFRRMRLPARPLILLCLLAALIAGCGSSAGDDSQPAPSAAEFPSAKGKTIASLLRASGEKPAKVVVAPAAQVFDAGENRYPFGVFTKGREQVTDADAAL